MFSLNGRRAVITGGASGIGLAIARQFAAQGAAVMVLDLDRETAERTAASLESVGGAEHVGTGCDVSAPGQVEAAFRRFDTPVDMLVNCAGIAHIGSLETTTAEDMDRLYAINVRGTFLTMKAALTPMLTQEKGVILNMASVAATAGIADRLAYSMTKGAVLSMTLSVAKDYIARGIRCNCVSPARVHTPFVDGFLARNYAGRESEQMAVLARAQPIGRMGTPEEIAALALYLCSDEAAFVTGCDFPIDGGFLNLR